MIDLTTTYLGLELRSPIVASASPLTRNVEAAKQMEAAGAGAIVLEAGEEARIERGGLSIISALSDSRFVLSRSDALPEVLLRARQAQAAVAAY